ncbi:hypothetical protein FB00_11290 [Cellulosimicrobium funkei]|uniref:Uncharacterized protein n=1 Tax=Cellulosimicrobium funkei TaxID=264251 RepID=A0A0H2L359_9MICO|nr:hypothetical protein [Cellulosimicrobium funkei]KLN34582.1 hypothetical protein FB00_11290 [Cellulosimicrobium funkei]
MGKHYNQPDSLTYRMRIRLREKGLKQMAERHARERRTKEQELSALRAEYELYLNEHPEDAR